MRTRTLSTKFSVSWCKFPPSPSLMLLGLSKWTSTSVRIHLANWLLRCSLPANPDSFSMLPKLARDILGAPPPGAAAAVAAATTDLRSVMTSLTTSTASSNANQVKMQGIQGIDQFILANETFFVGFFSITFSLEYFYGLKKRSLWEIHRLL